MNNIKFSVTIPAYKQDYLAEAIESALQQTYSNLEVIVVDDCSPYDLKSIVARFSDPRVRYYRNEKNCGAVDVVDNWNICLGYATGDYVLCMGDDDKLDLRCLQEYADLIDQYPGIGLLHGWTAIIDENSNLTNITIQRCLKESAYSLIWHRMVAYHLQFIGDFCFETEWLRKNGGFYKFPLAWSSDDISAIIGASKNGVANTQKVVFYYRRNRQTISSTGSIDVKMEAIVSQKKWYIDYLASHDAEGNDLLFKNQILQKLHMHFEKKQGLTIASDLKNNKFRIFRWILKRKKLQISNRTLIYAVMQSFK